ncbi:MAG: sulfatase-like hydrolase/transferase, partial [Planctomycetota bacterium]
KYGSTNHRDKKSLPLANDNQPLLPVNYLPSHPFNNTHMNVRDEVNVSGVWKNRDEATIRNEIGRQFACSENIDIQIGRVLEKLQAMGELDNTIVFYTADHGMAIGRHGLQGKQNLYEHTWRVPMVVSGPGIATGKRKQGNIYLLDVLSTLCDMAKIQAPQTNEGKSFLPVLTGEQDTVRETLFGAYSGGAKPGMRALRQGDWKLIQYESASDGVQEVQLFNLAENPHEFLAQHADSEVVSLTGQSPSKEQVNLASDKRYADKLLEMQKLLASEMRRLEDPHPMWNSDK